MRRLKILYLITKSNWGGAQRYVYDLATHLPEDKFEVKVVMGLPAGRQVAKGDLIDKLTDADIAVINIEALQRDINFRSDWGVFIKLIKLFRAERPDIVHLNSSKIGGLGAAAGRIAGVPRIIYTAHGWTFFENRPRWQKLAIKLFSWLTIRLCHRVIVIAESERRAVARWPAVARKLTLIHNGIGAVELESKRAAREIIREIAAITPDASNGVWIGTIAELHRNKGLEYLIEALAAVGELHADIHLVIIGEGEEKVPLERLIKELALTDRVHLAGHIPEATRLLRAFDLVVISSIKEGLPYFLLEAGLAKLPVVATEVGGIPEVIDSWRSGLLVTPGNSRALAGALALLIADRGKQKEFGQKLHATVMTNFLLTKMIEQTMAVYQS